MQFKQPEILYFLLFLLVPILVHLFQLQKFKKTPFSNVAFLQKISLKNRKSSKLKKWLILTARLLVFFGLIFAFSQPYFSDEIHSKKQHAFIYLDNSLSTSAKGKKGELLAVAIQEIIENSFENISYSLLTNTDFYENLSAEELKKTLLLTKTSGKESDLNAVLLQINSHLLSEIKTLNNYILISDFQTNNKNKEIDFTNVTHPISLIKLQPEQNYNLSIDSLYIEPKDNTDFDIYAVIKNQGAAKENISIAVFNSENPIAKQTFSIAQNETKTLHFPIQNNPNFKGIIQLENDDVFHFDNRLFFSLHPQQKTNVLSIGKTATFTTRIFNKEAYNFSSTSVTNINYAIAENQNLIILNELQEIPNSLTDFLSGFTKNGGTIAIIPNAFLNLNSYNQLLSKLKAGFIQPLARDSLQITDINYNHPFFTGVFEKSIQNFQYPYASFNYWVKTSKQNKLLSLENEQSFLSSFNLSNSNFYWFSSPLDPAYSNFTYSPLVVPVFYNIAKFSLNKPISYYTIGAQNNIEIPTRISKDQVLSIEGVEQSFIPLQQSYTNKVNLQIGDQLSQAGIYQVKNEGNSIQSIAFNYSNTESSLRFLDLNNLSKENSKLNTANSIKELLYENHKKNEVTWLWKWFLALAIVSLFFEILILKLFKP